jgi:heterogeneous nuclear ribonucleoprotein U-like protein 1
MSGDTVRISFCVNGQDQGVAFEVPSGKLNGSALFPHVVTKNSSFTCNFGTSDPWFPLPEGYSTYVGVANMNKETELVPGPKRPATKGDCEVSIKNFVSS